MGKAEVYTIPAEKLSEAVKDSPELYRDLMAIAGKRLHSTLNGLENLSMRGSYKRIAHRLVYLSNHFGEKTPAGTKICIQLTHQDLADMLSLTRETVSTGMIKLREKGLVKTGKHIVIPDIKKLLKEAYN
jgi:CRP/FNR family transcriptional regulator